MEENDINIKYSKKICLISLFPENKDETFEPPMPTSSRPYYLLGCNKANANNFYVSIFKDQSNGPENNLVKTDKTKILESSQKTQKRD